MCQPDAIVSSELFMSAARQWIAGVMAIALLGGVGALVGVRLLEDEESGGLAGQRETPPAAIRVAPVTRGTILNRRVFSGTLEAAARVTIAPKIAGRIDRLPVDLADTVTRGQVVAVLDSAEYAQAVTQAEAEVRVGEASLTEAENALKIAERELTRVTTLHERGIASDSQLDIATADQLAKTSAVAVAKAQLARAEAALESASIRLGYTTIHAEWAEGEAGGEDDERVVAARLVDVGDTVAANTPLLSIIELDPIRAVVFATEREYGVLARGQAVTITTDAYSRRTWEGSIARVAPQFERGSRQARVEIDVPNPDGLLKPGMFVRVEAVLGEEADVTIVPYQAIAHRDGQDIVFVVDETSMTAKLTPVEVGIREGERAAVRGEGIEGRVVTLGHQLLSDGSLVSIPEDAVDGSAGDGQTGRGP